MILVLALFSVFGCSQLENPDEVQPEEKLYLVASKNSLKANGTDEAYITARIPKDAGVVDVTFTTTGGLFIFSAGKSIKQYTDSLGGEYRYATTLLKTDSTVGAVYVTAEIAATRQRLTLQFSR